MKSFSISTLFLAMLVLVACISISQVQCDGDIIKHSGKKGDTIIMGHGGGGGGGGYGKKKKKGSYISHEGKGDLIMV